VGENAAACTDVCTQSGGTFAKCVDSPNHWPRSQVDFETILENIWDPTDVAKCSVFIDRTVASKFPFNGPAISEGVCWYNSKAPKFDCATASKGDDRRVCLCASTNATGITAVKERYPIPDAWSYPAVYKRAEKASISFTIKFPFFNEDAFECLGAQAGKTVTGDAKHHPEAFLKMASGIKHSLGSEALGIDFVAPKKVSDPLEAKIDVYAAPKDMSGAELFLAKSKIKEIGVYLVKKYPELKMCAPKHQWRDVFFETEFGEPPVFPASVLPTHDWSPASKEEISTDSVVPALVPALDGLRSVVVASAGVLLVAGVVVLWRRRKEPEMVCTKLESLVSE